MSTDISAEVGEAVIEVEKPVDPMLLKIRAQNAISSAVREYVEALRHYENANTEYMESCQSVREIVKPGTNIVVKLEYGKHVMLSRNEEGFTVEPIEVI